MVYLVEKYDTNHKLSASTEGEKYEQLQWLMFQASGQGSVLSLLSFEVMPLNLNQPIFRPELVVPTHPQGKAPRRCWAIQQRDPPHSRGIGWRACQQKLPRWRKAYDRRSGIYSLEWLHTCTARFRIRYGEGVSKHCQVSIIGFSYIFCE